MKTLLQLMMLLALLLCTSCLKTETDPLSGLSETVENTDESGSLETRAIAEAELSKHKASREAEWNEASFIGGAYPLYLPQIDEPAYYEYKVMTGSKECGYILVSTTDLDVSIPEFTTEGATLTEQYINATGRSDIRIVRYSPFTSVARVKDDAKTVIAHTVIDGMILIEEAQQETMTEKYDAYDLEYVTTLQEYGNIPMYEKEGLKEDQKQSNTRGYFDDISEWYSSGLDYKFSTGTYVASWGQPIHDKSNRYIGCGNVAWAMVYSYWHQFRGKSKLFNAIDLDINGRAAIAADSEFRRVSNREILKAMEKIYDYTNSKPSLVDDSLTATLPWSDMIKGLQYARSKGYSANGEKTGYGDWKRIHKDIKDDKPVILLINTPVKDKSNGGFPAWGVANHYVVVTGVKYDVWKWNRAIHDVRLRVNPGSGGPEKWIHYIRKGRAACSHYEAFTCGLR